MNKRISDEKLCILSNRKSRDMYYLSPEEFDNLVNDLKDAREALKKYEPQKPSLSQHLQKLANKHKMCFALNLLQALVVYGRGAFFVVNAEEFFGFKREDFTCDMEINDVIYPEATDE